ncbi:MAG: SAM-dependent chlorinase/fluorinase [Abditibacteriales bacterium]|nr:SAM-dependent chlorinase/fluorinase [Abditibacteriales bacterium]MDW8367721.1 SAM-dependent chlorinase/fluorinase [Abditibacteriales bacterium]
MRVITLLTDFGLQDTYVGAMKGVILSINPHAQVVDLTHNIPPQDIEAAAFLLNGAYRYFPAETIHVVVVDPGVGSERRGLAGRVGEYFFVAPDNGVLSWVLADASSCAMVELKNTAYFLPRISRTFHGRDVFAPVAAHLSRGVPLTSFGPPLTDPVRLDVPQPVIEENRILAQVIHVDRFGNLITNVMDETLARWRGCANVVIEIAGQRINEVSATYSAAPPHGLLALFGSSGHLEIAVREGNAAEQLGVGRGARVSIGRHGRS